MEATKLEEAFIIFETLNARGRELETADLLKNSIFSYAKDINEAQQKWSSMISKLDKGDPTRYIRCFWNSQQPFAREKALYREISSKINTPRDSKDFLTKLEDSAQCYHDIENPDDNVEFTDERLIRSLQALQLLKARSFYPVVLAMKLSDSNFTEEDIREVVEKIESYVFRNATICGKTANKTEVFFAGIARDIYNGNLDTVELICNQIANEVVSDKEFEEQFSRWKGSSRNKETIRYILRKVHKHLDPNLEINIDSSEVHIEHIMPIKITQWKDIDDQTHEDYLWRLGNLMLLSGSINTSASNKPYEVKKSRYLESKIEPNKEFEHIQVWNKEEIEARQQRLAKLALDIWKI